MFMSDRRRILLLVVALSLSFGFAHAQSPQLGEPVSAEELAMIDFTIMPDGRGLPAARAASRAVSISSGVA